MTATERLAEIKARAEAATEYRRSSLSPVLISQTQWDRERLLAALEAVLEVNTGNSRTLYGINFEAGMAKALWLVHQAVNEALGGDQ